MVLSGSTPSRSHSLRAGGGPESKPHSAGGGATGPHEIAGFLLCFSLETFRALRNLDSQVLKFLITLESKKLVALHLLHQRCLIHVRQLRFDRLERPLERGLRADRHRATRQIP